MAIYDFERCSVYLLEDNSYIRKVVESLLHGIKFGRVSSAPDGAEAIEFFKTLHAGARLGGGPAFDVVISDLNMPGLTGVELAQKIKEHPVFKATPVFLATSDAYRDQAAVDTVDHFVAKPFSVADMRTAIEAHLGALT